MIQDGSYRRHVQTLRTRLRKARRATIERLSALGIAPWIEPRAGMFLWCQLPGGMDAAECARAALAQGVVLAPGDVFSLTRTAPDFMRFNVAQCVAPGAAGLLEQVFAPG